MCVCVCARARFIREYVRTVLKKSDTWDSIPTTEVVCRYGTTYSIYLHGLRPSLILVVYLLCN